MAWLSAVPDEENRDTRKKVVPKSRYQQLVREDGEEQPAELTFPPLPPHAEYIIELLNEVGPASSNAMGIQGVSWQEIDSWVRQQEIRLSPWEKKLIKNLSDKYAVEYSLSSDKNRPAPYIDVEKLPSRDDVASRLLAAFAALKKKDGED